MRLLRGTAVALAALAMLAGCQKEPPQTAQGWAELIPELREDAEVAKAAEQLKATAVDQLQAGEDLSALQPQLIALLEEDAVVRAQAAWLLGEVGTEEAAGPLVNALDFSAAVADKEAVDANIKVAEALGKLRAKEATRPLLRLAKSPESFTALAAVEALGKIGDPKSVEPLMELATSETVDTFISKNAVEALGEIGDPRAMPALIKMLFRERGGVSFYREASFAIFQVGEDATETLKEILAGKNDELMEWAKAKGVIEAGIYAKSAQVLGDLADPSAAPMLRAKLSYTNDALDMQLLPRVMAAQALGKLRDENAVLPISRLLDEEEANSRGLYGRALVMIGDRRAVPYLAKAAVTGQWDAREEAQWSFARLSRPGDLAQWDRIVKTNSSVDTCVRWLESGTECYVKRAECIAEFEKQCSPRMEKYAKRAEKYRPMVVAADECKDSVECWIGKLKDENGRVREKAAWELARHAEPKSLDPLLEAVKGDDLEARFAALHALDGLVFGNDLQIENMEAAKKVAETLEQILADEKGKVHFVKINEDTKRLALKIERALQSA